MWGHNPRMVFFFKGSHSHTRGIFMAWTYSDYITMTGSAKLTELRLHIKEVSDAIQGKQTMNTDGRNMSKFDLTKYLQETLIPEEHRMTKEVAAEADTDYGGLGIGLTSLKGMN